MSPSLKERDCVKRGVKVWGVGFVFFVRAQARRDAGGVKVERPRPRGEDDDTRRLSVQRREIGWRRRLVGCSWVGFYGVSVSAPRSAVAGGRTPVGGRPSLRCCKASMELVRPQSDGLNQADDHATRGVRTHAERASGLVVGIM
jgi:hypothetical protein